MSYNSFNQPVINPPVNDVIQRQYASYEPYPSPVYTQPREIKREVNTSNLGTRTKGGRKRSTGRRSTRRHGKRSHTRGKKRVHSRRR